MEILELSRKKSYSLQPDPRGVDHVRLGNQQFSKKHYGASYGDIVAGEDDYVMVLKGYVILLSARYVDPEGKEILNKILRSIKFVR